MSKPKNKYAEALGISPQLLAHRKRTDCWRYKDIEYLAKHFKMKIENVAEELRGNNAN